jgi:hypothetical protein
MTKNDKSSTPGLQNSASVADNEKGKTQAQKAHLKKHHDKSLKIKQSAIINKPLKMQESIEEEERRKGHSKD